MSTLPFEVKEFIEQNIDLIEEKRWDEVYDNATFNLDSESTGKFTEAMLKLGIDPLSEQGLDWIPDYYLSDSSIIDFKIPKIVHSLGEGCFSYSSLQRIIIPKSVETLRDYVFYECSKLTDIMFLGDVKDIGSDIFYGHSVDLIVKCKEGSYIADYCTEQNIAVEYI